MAIRQTLSKHWRVLFACAIVLAGCLSVPLGDPEKSAVDEKLLGWWESTPGDPPTAHELILMQAYDTRTYLVWYYSYAQDGANVTPKGAMTFKGWLTTIGTARFLTLQNMNSATELQADKEKDRYTVCRMDEADGGFRLRNVSDSFVKDCTTPDALLKNITENVNNDALYTGEKSPLYQKAPDARKDAIGKILKEFNP